MLSGIASDYTKQDVIKLAQWLIAENAYYTNYVHSAMDHKQKELTAKLREAQEPNEHLAAANDELHERRFGSAAFEVRPWVAVAEDKLPA